MMHLNQYSSSWVGLFALFIVGEDEDLYILLAYIWQFYFIN